MHTSLWLLIYNLIFTIKTVLETKQGSRLCLTMYYCQYKSFLPNGSLTLKELRNVGIARNANAAKFPTVPAGHHVSKGPTLLYFHSMCREIKMTRGPGKPHEPYSFTLFSHRPFCPQIPTPFHPPSLSQEKNKKITFSLLFSFLLSHPFSPVSTPTQSPLFLPLPFSRPLLALAHAPLSLPPTLSISTLLPFSHFAATSLSSLLLLLSPLLQLDSRTQQKQTGAEREKTIVCSAKANPQNIPPPSAPPLLSL